MASRRSPPPPDVLAQFEARRARMLARASPKPVLLMALGIVAFNLWDRWIDPEHANAALALRAATALALLPSYVALRRGVPDAAAKYVHGWVFLASIVGVAYASGLVRDGFLWGAAGTVAFPMILAFYSIPQRFYFALTVLALALIAPIGLLLSLPSAHVVNFAVMYALMVWVGWTASRVLRHQQLRAFALEVSHAEDARTDALTGLASRRHIDALGRRSLELARRRDDRPIALLMIDVDHFKAINDRRGHDAGDRVLQAVAAALRRALRASDHLGRWGGEEFLAVLIGANARAAAETAQRAVEAVRALAIDAGGERVAVSVSVGVASQGDGGGWEELVKRADDALYRAKHAGRDRVAA